MPTPNTITLIPNRGRDYPSAARVLEHLAGIVQQLINGVSPVRVDPEKLLRKPDDSAGSLPQR